MTSEQTSDPTNTRGYKPSHEKWSILEVVNHLYFHFYLSIDDIKNPIRPDWSYPIKGWWDLIFNDNFGGRTISIPITN